MVSRILIIEDEPRISSFIEKGLRAEGFTPTVAADGVTGLDYALTGQFDLVILDIGLPELDGFNLLLRMRESGSSIPVIVLTARDSVVDTVRGLEGGADDYMSKPFRFAELAARVRLRLRARTEGGDSLTILEQGPVHMDLLKREVRVNGQLAELSAREFVLAEMFLRHSHQVLSREQLLSHVWGYEFDPESNIVDVYVGYLRRKLGADLITTVRGMGYRFTPLKQRR